MSSHISSHSGIAGLVAAAIAGWVSGAVAQQSEPLRIVMQPGQSIQQAIREAGMAADVAKLRADWAAAKAAGQVGPATYSNPKITAVKVLTPTVNVAWPLPTPKVEVSFQTDTPGLRSIYYAFRAPTGSQTIYNSYAYPGPMGVKTGTIDFRPVNSGFMSWLTEYAMPGQWSLTYIGLCDYAGDCTQYDYTSFPAVFTVVNNGKVDSTPPQVLSGKILTTSVSVSSTNPRFLAQLRLSDDLSGAIYPLVFVQPPGGSYSFSYETVTPAPVLLNNAYSSTYLGSGAVLGTWKITAYGACDFAGNCFFDGSDADVKALFGATTFTVKP